MTPELRRSIAAWERAGADAPVEPPRWGWLLMEPGFLNPVPSAWEEPLSGVRRLLATVFLVLVVGATVVGAILAWT